MLLSLLGFNIIDFFIKVVEHDYLLNFPATTGKLVQPRGQDFLFFIPKYGPLELHVAFLNNTSLAKTNKQTF